MTRTSQASFRRALDQLEAALGYPQLSRDVRFRAQDVSQDTPYKAAEVASAALASGARIAADIGEMRDLPAAAVDIDSRHAELSLVSFAYLRFHDASRAPAARTAPEQRTAAAGFLPTRDDRWIYLHPGFPHNTRGLLNLLDCDDDRDQVGARVASMQGLDLENAIADAGLCGAMVRSAEEWDASSAGQQLASRPVIDIVQLDDSPPRPLPGGAARPLSGVNVLDLTRVLAGPTCARTLASYGASVLRVGAEHLPTVPVFAVDTGFGKRACNLDLREASARDQLEQLIAKADVFSQGFRTGAMERLGLGVRDVVARRSGMIYVSINCYGHEGDWRQRPGWEQLAQVVTGMTPVQARHQGQTTPTLLPVALNDYTTGYLAATGVLAALRRRAEVGGSYWVRVSLARTAMWTRALGERRSTQPRSASSAEIARMSATMETAWGQASYLRPAVRLSSSEIGWQRAPSPLGADPAAF